MNCHRAQRWLLLHDSGELRPHRYARLKQHLDKCEDCRDFAVSLEQLRRTVRADAVEPLSPPCLDAILAAARPAAVVRNGEMARRVAWRIWGWALAASVGIVVGVVAWVLITATHSRSHRTAFTDRAETEIQRILSELDNFAFAVDQALSCVADDLEALGDIGWEFEHETGVTEEGIGS